jgi:hypothetical protein
MSSHIFGRVGFQAQPDTRTLTNQPTSSELEEMGEADEPPDDKQREVKDAAQFQKYAPTKPSTKQSLLTKFLHTSDSDSEQEMLAKAETHRTQSSASTYSRGSVVSMAELTSDGGHVTPPTQTPSPPLPPAQFGGIGLFSNMKPFEARQVPGVKHVDPVAPQGVETKVEAGLGRKRCITFACGSKAKAKVETPAPVPAPAAPVEEKVEARRPSMLKFCCPSKTETKPESKKPRKTSPAPRARQSSPAKIVESEAKEAPEVKRPLAVKSRADDSDSDSPEAMRFHEFASEKEVDDWTREQGCFPHPLTVNDTLTKENKLRRLGQEVEDEDEDEEEEEEDEEEEAEEEDLARFAGFSSDEDEGFQSDDEHGFAHSDDEDDDPEYDWWGPGTVLSKEFIRPSGQRLARSNSISSTESAVRPALDKQGKAKTKSQPVDFHRPELPDSTDFVCGTLDEDKPLEQAYLNHLEARRAAKHRPVPQDFDPTFPTSDPEMEEEDEADKTESDHTNMFPHGEMDMEESTYPSRLIPKKRSPLGSPRRVLRSPPPSKKISLHRSPPPHGPQYMINHAKFRARSPAPSRRPIKLHQPRLSASLPRKHGRTHIRIKDFASAYTSVATSDNEDDDDQCQTPKIVNRGAIDIKMGLETKRQRRREKMYEKHCKLRERREKLLEENLQKSGIIPSGLLPAFKGKGCERMREMVTGGKAGKVKTQAPNVGTALEPSQSVSQMSQTPIGVMPMDIQMVQSKGEADVHMMSY